MGMVYVGSLNVCAGVLSLFVILATYRGDMLTKHLGVTALTVLAASFLFVQGMYYIFKDAYETRKQTEAVN